MAHPSSFISSSQSGNWLLFNRGFDRPVSLGGHIGEYVDAYNLADASANTGAWVPRFSYNLPTYHDPHVNKNGTLVHIDTRTPTDEMLVGRLELRDSGPVFSKFLTEDVPGQPTGRFLSCGSLLYSSNLAQTRIQFYDLQRREVRHSMTTEQWQAAIPTDSETPTTDTVSTAYSDDNRWRILLNGSQASAFDISASGTLDTFLRLTDLSMDDSKLVGLDRDTKLEFSANMESSLYHNRPFLSLKVANELYVHARPAASSEENDKLVLARSAQQRIVASGDPDKLRFAPWPNDETTSPDDVTF